MAIKGLTGSKAAQEAADNLYREMLGDLDADRYGFGWWHGYLDPRRIALISEYLVASVSGLRDAIASAEFCFSEWSEYQHADDMWVRAVLKGGPAGATEDQILQALQRGEHEQKRKRRIDLAREHVFYHLAQAFDRLSAVTIGVAALDTNIVKADWNVIADDTKFNKACSRRLGGQPSPGAEFQQELHSRLVASVETAGPPDWREWVDGKRNTNAHRAPKVGMIVIEASGRKQPPRLVELFERQPRWSASEELVGNRGGSIDDVWLLRDPGVILAGCLASTAQVVGEALDVLTDAWRRRKADTNLLVQPGGQWSKVLEEATVDFDGYGDAVAMPAATEIRVHPDLGLRMRASGVFDDRFWK